ncbi:hypothetical protein V6N11_017928 [Hibiscus sabdariffa]|uniref:Uncharacterized protein n=1 Tax=Hibiscus sabdariffa TaxID=183260 RepID=A0ABR2T6I6_9ROSI
MSGTLALAALYYHLPDRNPCLSLFLLSNVIRREFLLDGLGDVATCSCRIKAQRVQTHTSSAIPLVQGVEKLWNTRHNPSHEALTNGDSADGLVPTSVNPIPVVEEAIVHERRGDTAVTASLHENSRDEHGSLRELAESSEGTDHSHEVSSIGVRDDYSHESLNPEELSVRSTTATTDDRVFPNSVARADTQTGLHDVHVPLEVESFQEADNALESVGCSNVAELEICCKQL